MFGLFQTNSVDCRYVYGHACVYAYVCLCVHVCVYVCMYKYIGMDILRFMHVYVLVFMLVAVFTVRFCAHIISFDDNLVYFCPAPSILPQERRCRLVDLPVCKDWHTVFRASSVNMHFIFFMSFFCVYV